MTNMCPINISYRRLLPQLFGSFKPLNIWCYEVEIRLVIMEHLAGVYCRISPLWSSSLFQVPIWLAKVVGPSTRFSKMNFRIFSLWKNPSWTISKGESKGHGSGSLWTPYGVGRPRGFFTPMWTSKAPFIYSWMLCGFLMEKHFLSFL